MRLYEIGDRLYVSGSPKTQDVEQLRAEGVDAIFCLSKKRTPPEVITSVSFWLYTPIPDGKVVPVAELDEIVSAAWLELEECGSTVLLHCLQGRNRSMLAAVLVERRRWGWSGTEALTHARAIRPSSLHNEAFVRYLKELPRPA